MDAVEIVRLRKKMGLNKSKFGRIFGVGGTQVDRWESGMSTPPKKRMGILEKLHHEQFDKLKIKEDNLPYLRNDEMGQAEPYGKINIEDGHIENEARECRILAARYYEKLSSRAKAEIDIRAAAIIITKYSNEVDNEKDRTQT